MDLSGLTRPVTDLLDGAMDRAPVLGYTRIGSGLRRRWWPADPEPDALIGKRVVVSGATAGIGLQMARAFADLGASGSQALGLPALQYETRLEVLLDVILVAGPLIDGDRRRVLAFLRCCHSSGPVRSRILTGRPRLSPFLVPWTIREQAFDGPERDRSRLRVA